MLHLLLSSLNAVFSLHGEKHHCSEIWMSVISSMGDQARWTDMLPSRSSDLSCWGYYLSRRMTGAVYSLSATETWRRVNVMHLVCGLFSDAQIIGNILNTSLLPWYMSSNTRHTDTVSVTHCTGLFISPSGISKLNCTTTKTDTVERSISMGRKSLQVFLY